MKIVDVLGKKCPMPLVETKKALKEGADNEIIKLITDSENAVKNVSRYLADNAIEVEIQNTGNTYELIFAKDGSKPLIEEAEAYCSSNERSESQFIVVFSKDRLGEGSNDLGSMLIGGMLTTLTETDRIPDKMIFMNSGIKLVVEGSPVLELLQNMEKKGSELLVCGTCLDFFGKMDELRVGHVSNMLEILDIMATYSKVINI